VLLSGTILTGRDTAHKWMVDRFIQKSILPSVEDMRVYGELKKVLCGGLIFHCGPVVGGLETGEYRMLSAGPTTSMREEPYMGKIIRHFDMKGVIGKGGMGEKTLAACTEAPAAYFHAVGGAAAVIARAVEKVHGVLKLDFGIPEAMWIIQVRDFPAFVTMDSHGTSLHNQVKERSQKVLDRLIR
jgi:fumarate hydratase class I